MPVGNGRAVSCCDERKIPVPYTPGKRNTGSAQRRDTGAEGAGTDARHVVKGLLSEAAHRPAHHRQNRIQSGLQLCRTHPPRVCRLQDLSPPRSQTFKLTRILRGTARQPPRRRPSRMRAAALSSWRHRTCAAWTSALRKPATAAIAFFSRPLPTPWSRPAPQQLSAALRASLSARGRCRGGHFRTDTVTQRWR
eukprot:3933662-Rhodomonas_salina.3